MMRRLLVLRIHRAVDDKFSKREYCQSKMAQAMMEESYGGGEVLIEDNEMMRQTLSVVAQRVVCGGGRLPR